MRRDMLPVDDYPTVKEIVGENEEDDQEEDYEDGEGQPEDRDVEYVTRVFEHELPLAEVRVDPPKPWRSSIEVVREARKDILWLIQGVVPAGAIILLSGRESSMKTLLAMS